MGSNTGVSTVGRNDMGAISSVVPSQIIVGYNGTNIEDKRYAYLSFCWSDPQYGTWEAFGTTWWRQGVIYTPPPSTVNPGANYVLHLFGWFRESGIPWFTYWQ